MPAGKQIIKSAIFLLIFSSFVFLAWSGLVPIFLGMVAGGFLFLVIASWWRYVFDKLFDIPHGSFRAWIFSWFWTLVCICTFAGVGLALGKLNAIVGAVAFLLSGVLALFFKKVNFVRAEHEIDVEVQEEIALDKILVLLYLVFFFLGLNVLLSTETGGVVSSPWQVLPTSYILLYFFATVVLIRIFFTNLSTRAILALIIFHTFLTVSYLPFTHSLFYGADIWRHLAIQNSFIQDSGWRDVAVTGVRAVFDWGKLSYAQFLSAGVVINKIFGISLIVLDKWLQPILWSFLFPTLVFSLTRELGAGKKQSSLVALLGLLPFALQFAGSFTLPVNFGFLVWLFLLLLLFKFEKERLKWQAIFLAVFGILMVFGYSSYFILFWLFWLILEIARWSSDWSRGGKFLANLVLFFGTFLSIPLFELVFNYSNWPTSISVLSAIKQFFGNFSGWYLAFGPRPHDITTGNILFNQMPSYSFVANFLTTDRYWLIGVAAVFWLSVLFGVFRSLREKDFRIKSLAFLTVGLYFGYFVCRYLLVGENILSRRLDVVLAFLAIFFVAKIWLEIFERNKELFLRFRYLLAIVVVFFLASAITASYSLGPDTKTVSVDEYQAAKVVWEQVYPDKKFCILGDTYPLLAVEAISGKKIVGGGFPISANFAQPERLQLLGDLKTRPIDDVLSDAKKITGTDKCWLIIDAVTVKRIDKKPFANINNILIFKD